MGGYSNSESVASSGVKKLCCESSKVKSTQSSDYRKVIFNCKIFVYNETLRFNKPLQFSFICNSASVFISTYLSESG